jgi:hypothetical protein
MSCPRPHFGSNLASLPSLLPGGRGMWGGVANRQEKNIDFWWIFWFYMVLYGLIWFYMVLFLFYMVLYSFIWPYYGLMWVKQCHKRTIPQITSFIGGIFAIPKWVVYDIVLTKLI